MEFNQDLIQQLRDGDIAIYHSDKGSVSLLRDVLMIAFPHDPTPVEGTHAFYFRSNGNNRHMRNCANSTIINSVPLSKFVLYESPCKLEKHEPKEPEFKWGEIVQARNGETFNWVEGIYCSMLPKSQSFNSAIIAHVVLVKGIVELYSRCRKILQPITLTHQQIADKFGCTVEQLNIIP